MKSLILLLIVSLPAFAARPIDCARDLAVFDAGADPAERVYREFLYLSSGFLAENLRWPGADESEILLLRAKDVLAEERDVQLKDLNLNSAMADLKTWFPDTYLYIRRKVAAGYARAVRQTDIERRFRTVPTTPSDELFFLSLVKARGNGGPKLLSGYVRGKWNVDYLLDLFEGDRSATIRQGIFPQPLIFKNGRIEIEQAARFDFPAAFTNFVDTNRIVTEERAAKTVAALNSSRGFIAVSWTAGKPLNLDFLESLLKLAEEKDFVLLVGPTQQNFEGLPEIFLTHPRIHLITHTIENPALQISNEPINPDIENPLAELKKAGRYKPGQTLLVFHPHLMLEPVATTNNSLAPVVLMSTGSLNDPRAVFSSPTLGRRRESNRAFHKRKAWIFEKGATGTQDLWHPRPISFYDDRENNGPAGIIDMGRAYEFDYSNGGRTFRSSQVDPEVLYLGDPHDPVTDPALVHSLVSDLGLSPNTEVAFQGGDTFDFSSLSHWSNEKMIELNLKHQRDGLLMANQVNGVIQVINALLQRFPNARYRQIVGNHDEWLNRVLEKTPDIQRVINGDFLDELNFVVKTLKLDIWEYIFKHREKVLSSLLIAHPDKRAEIVRRILPVYDPNRIDVLKRGDHLLIGPPHRKNDVGRHGDRTSFGKKSASLKEQAKAMPEGGGVTGHTHRLGIYGEVMDAGTLGPLEADYGAGFFSASGQGIAAVYPNGTKQLLIFNRRAGTFRTAPYANIPSDFFGEPLRAVPNDNQRVGHDEALGSIQAELNRLRGSLSNRD